MLYIGKKIKKGEKRMNKLTRKLIMSIMTLAFAFIALGTTTFAWFTLSNTVTVSQFEAKVTAGSGIEISVDDGLNYYSTVPVSAIEDALALKNFNIASGFKLVDLTSTDGINFKTLANEEVTKGYIELKLTFRSPEKDTNVYLGGDTMFDLTGTGIGWTSDAKFVIGKNGEDDVYFNTGQSSTFYAAHAARMSFTGSVKSGESSIDKTLVYEAPELEPISGTHFGNRVLNNEPSPFWAVSYYEVKNQVTLSLPTEGNLPVSSITSGTTTEATDDSNLIIVTLSEEISGYYVGVVTLRIWIEGWDPDCFNAILEDSLKVNLHFITK